MTTEEWKPIPEFPDYEASSDGRVRRAQACRYGRRHSTEALVIHDNKKGGISVRVKRGGKQTARPVHSLVYEAFVGKIPAKQWVRHKDGNKKNCRLSNLELYCPPRYEDLAGKAFGYWTVVRYSRMSAKRNRLWICKCECGTEKEVGGHHLRYGASKSCGCKSTEFAKGKISGENHYLWMGGANNTGSLAWCSARINGSKDNRKKWLPIISTPEEVQKLWMKSPGQCHVCGEKPELNKLHLDHDHATGIARGFLCNHCNVGIGMAGDSPDRLRQLADYVESSRISDGKIRAS